MLRYFLGKEPLPPIKKMDDLEDLRKSEWSPEFETLMRNRLVMGAFRYGKLHAPGKKKWDRVGSLKEKIKLYEKTGNLEILVDMANMCLLEFEEGTHPLRHMNKSDDVNHTKSI